MPLRRITPWLRTQAMLSLARSVASAVIYCVKAEKKNILNSKKKKKKTKHNGLQGSQPVLFLASKELSRMKIYLDNARPKQSKQDLFQEILVSMTRMFCDSLKSNHKKRIGDVFLERIKDFENALAHVLNMFLESDIKSINFSNTQHLIMNWVDSCRLSNNDPEFECVMNHGQVEKAMLNALSQNATKLLAVEDLVWPHLVSGELLRVIGKHCRSLQILILSCNCQVAGRDEDESTFTLLAPGRSWEDDFIKALESLYDRSPGNFDGTGISRGCHNLKKLVLPHLEDENEIAISVMANALTVLTKLEYVSGIPMLSILMRYKNKSKTLSKLQLRNICDHDLYMRRKQPNESYLKNLLPKLEIIDVIASENITRKLTETFPSISTLKLDWPNFESYTKSFPNLYKLDLILDYKCAWQLLRNVGKNCKNIKSITLRQPTMSVSSDHEDGVPPPRIPSLQHFQLVRSSFIEFTAFKQFCMGAPNLKKLEITLINDRNYIVDEFTDRLIHSISPYLQSLESFTVESVYRYNLCMHLNCVLTLDTVRELIDKCENISYIGHLDSWDVEEKDIDELTHSLKLQNFKLQIQ